MLVIVLKFCTPHVLREISIILNDSNALCYEWTTTSTPSERGLVSHLSVLSAEVQVAVIRFVTSRAVSSARSIETVIYS